MLNAYTTTWIAERARALGFSACGVVRAEKFPELARSEEWLSRGYAGEMKYLSDARRGDLQNVMPGVRSVIVCVLTYNTAQARTAEALETAKNGAQGDGGPRGWISRYAWGDDYHEVLRGKLERLLEELRVEVAVAEGFEGRVYADTGPINERVFAKHAGLGWVGKNTLLLNEQLGSYFFLGTILTTLDLEPSVEEGSGPPADRCGTCRKCIDACPTEALVEPYLMDARKCISYLTIELRGAVPKELREAMGQHVFGCDICQDVCPWNRTAPITLAREFQPRVFAGRSLGADGKQKAGRSAGEVNEEAQGVPLSEIESTKTPVSYEWATKTTVAETGESLFFPKLEWLASLGEEEFREIFRGSAIKRTKWVGLLRNVCIAMGNSKPARNSETHRRAVEALQRLALLKDTVVAESAQWAISRIQEQEVAAS